ncbi:PKD domain-containing protein [Arenibacter sp. F20364]|uniref:PKD domain-containing protein n=1 Tax=Arenibacter sp. F20364 TaxID=2926415 RepID=UPI001FF4F17E|nr:PKD domain-containing protein [Arenibacter sp. F20364]MCK0191608.1 PKD domain-containing protein [Arenibacter sp. F20364]
MKNFYAIIFMSIFVVSCTKEDKGDITDPEQEISLTACFTISKDTIAIGESLQLTNCSKDAVIFSYDFGNNEISNQESPSVSFQEGGNFTISLVVYDDQKNSATFSKKIFVEAAVESYYLFPDISAGYNGLPIEMGINPQNGNIFYLEKSEDMVNLSTSKFYYKELGSDFVPSSNYIADQQFNTKNAYINFLGNGNKNIHFSRTLPELYGSHEITLNSNWALTSILSSATKYLYGYLKEDVNFIFYGTQKDNGTYKAVIEKRNANGDAFDVQFKTIGSNNAMLAAMIKTTDGYVAYGGTFDKNIILPFIQNYRPVLTFFDTNLTVTKTAELSNSVLGTQITEANHLNGAYHLIQLSNGNLVAYGNGELSITDSEGNHIKTHNFNEDNNIQAMISLGDSFVISTGDGYLRKFDPTGTEIKKLNYKGSFIPELLEINNKLFFVAGYRTKESILNLGELSVIKILYGAVDKDLNMIDLASIFN